MTEKESHDFLNLMSGTMLESGFHNCFILGAIIQSENSVSYPYHINFNTDLFVDFLIKFLKEEEHYEIKEKLLERLQLINFDDVNMNDFIKLVNF